MASLSNEEGDLAMRWPITLARQTAASFPQKRERRQGCGAVGTTSTAATGMCPPYSAGISIGPSIGGEVPRMVTSVSTSVIAAQPAKAATIGMAVPL